MDSSDRIQSIKQGPETVSTCERGKREQSRKPWGVISSTPQYIRGSTTLNLLEIDRYILDRHFRYNSSDTLVEDEQVRSVAKLSESS